MARIVGPEENVSGTQETTALRYLNQMLDSWSAATVGAHVVTSESITLTASVAQYNIGTAAGCDFNTARPIKVLDSYFSDGEADQPVTVIGREEYNAISDKTEEGYPSNVYYEPTSPNGSLSFFPVPNSTYTVMLNSIKPLANFTVNAEVTLPPGYEWAIVNSLAEVMRTERGWPVDQRQMQQAASAREAIFVGNVKNKLARSFNTNPI